MAGCTIEPDRTVSFLYINPAAAEVAVAGDFTGWSPRPMQRSDGGWAVKIGPLAPGAYAYKYVVDGRWIGDPENPLGRDDGYGGRNAAFVIGGQPLGDPRAIRVASLNLHTWQEENAHAKLEWIAFGMAALRADLLLLQEVGEHVSDPSKPNAGELVKGYLERCTGRPWHHEWRMAHIGFDVYREGLSILSPEPLTDVEVWPLGRAALGRIALVATTTIAGKTLRVASTHLTWGADGGEEARMLRAKLDADRTERAMTLVAGDFNAGPDEPQIRELVDGGFVDAAASIGRAVPTFGLPPQDRIDYHLVRPSPRVEAFVRIFDGAPAERGFHPRVSDHAGVLGAYRFV